MTALMDVQLIEQETEDFSSPKNLLLRLAGASISVEHSPMQLEIDPELSLGLSLGGWFATEPREIRLLRSSSNASHLAFTSETQIPRVPAQIARTFSLPPGVDEESRKRKEIQTMDMVEVKRKRKEKRGGSRLPMKVVGIEVPEEPALLAERRQHSSEFNGRMPEGSDISSLSISSNVTSLANTGHKLIAVDPLLTRIRSVNSLQENDNILKTTTVNLARPKDTGWNLMDEMPCVSVKGAPPHYRRIDGFLYKYRQGEEIRIVCVCHGSFFTPAEFVKHAGGGDVAHPLRHIVVNPCPSVYY